MLSAVRLGRVLRVIYMRERDLAAVELEKRPRDSPGRRYFAGLDSVKGRAVDADLARDFRERCAQVLPVRFK